MSPEDLANLSLEPISPHRVPNLARDRHPQPQLACRVLQQKDYRRRNPQLAAGVVRPPEIQASGEPKLTRVELWFRQRAACVLWRACD